MLGCAHFAEGYTLIGRGPQRGRLRGSIGIRGEGRRIRNSKRGAGCCGRRQRISRGNGKGGRCWLRPGGTGSTGTARERSDMIVNAP